MTDSLPAPRPEVLLCWISEQTVFGSSIAVADAC